jgi:hypothetical protein
MVKDVTDVLEASKHPSASLQYACLHNLVNTLRAHRTSIEGTDFSKQVRDEKDTPEHRPTGIHDLHSVSVTMAVIDDMDNTSICTTLASLIDGILAGISERFKVNESGARDDSLRHSAIAFLLDPSTRCSMISDASYENALKILEQECSKRGACNASECRAAGSVMDEL